MKNKKMLNEELNRMKKLSGLINESYEEFYESLDDQLKDYLEAGEITQDEYDSAVSDYLESEELANDFYTGRHEVGYGSASAFRYLLDMIKSKRNAKSVSDETIQEFHNINSNIEINGKKVDISSIEIEGIDKGDYPDFSDAYVASAQFEDGSELNEDELMELESSHGDTIHELIFDRQLYLEEGEMEENMNEGFDGGVLTYDTLPGKVKEYFNRNITVSVAFVKKDGTVRHMAFRRNLKSYEKSDKEKTDAQINVLKNNNLMNVYDTNVYIKTKKETGDPALAAKSSFRNFKLENVLAFLCGGEVFDMRDNNKIKERFGEEVYNSLTKSMVSALEKDEAEGEIGMKRDETMNESFVRGIVRSIIADFMVKK